MVGLTEQWNASMYAFARHLGLDVSATDVAEYREGPQSPSVEAVSRLYATLSFVDDALYQAAVRRFKRDAAEFFWATDSSSA